MLNIPSIPKGYGPWKIKIQGNTSKLIKDIISEFIKLTLVCHKIKNPEMVIEVMLKTEEAITKDHKIFLNEEGPTDTISIPIDNKQIGYCILGTMILCIPIIKKDAEFLKREFVSHLAHITIHSTLHLLGYDHQTPEQKQSMEAKEIIILAKLGIKSPYINLPQ